MNNTIKAWLITAAIVLVLSSFFYAASPPRQTLQQNAVLTADEKVANAEWYMRRHFKQLANDPDSVEFIAVRSMNMPDSTGVLKFEVLFRAKNGFGALVIGRAKVMTDLRGKIIAIEEKP